jgi:hypothetical protein
MNKLQDPAKGNTISYDEKKLTDKLSKDAVSLMWMNTNKIFNCNFYNPVNNSASSTASSGRWEW